MLITIDGPAGSGKSTVAKALARRLGFSYLDTGAMYRAVALAGTRHRVDWQRPEQLALLADELNIEVAEDRVLLDGEDVTQLIRTPEVTAVTRFAADNPQVRSRLVELQRAASRGRNMVTEGRDQGSVVFPEAECKIYLTATPEERARRRLADFQDQGAGGTLESVMADLVRRDREDKARAVGPLVRPSSSIDVPTDGAGPDEIVDRLESIARGIQGQSSL